MDDRTKRHAGWGDAARAALAWALMVRRHLWVKGKVQGVWFRGACAEQARALGVSGWARNLPDGRVEVLAEGEDEAVGHLVDWCPTT